MLLEGKKGLVLNVTNEKSIAWAVAKAAVAHGAEVGVGAQNERMMETVQKLIANEPKMKAFMVDFSDDVQLAQLAVDAQAAYGSLDFLVHSAAFAKKDDLQGRFIDTSRDGFALALDISAYSFVTLCKHLEPILNDDASVMAMSYLGSVRACMNYNVMGVAKAALESSARYLSVDLGVRGIRVNILSPGPMNTVAARGVRDLLSMINAVKERAPLKRDFTQTEVGQNAVYLMSDLSVGVTGQVIYIDSGYSIAGT